MKERPEIGLGLNLQPVRVPAEDVVHLFRPDFPGQVRGVSWFAPAILRLAEHDEWHGALLHPPESGALLAGTITTNDGAVPFGGEQNGEAIISSLEPGAIVVLPPGKDVSFSDPPAIAQEANDFRPHHPARDRLPRWACPMRCSPRRPLCRQLFLDPRRPRRVAPPYRDAHQHNVIVFPGRFARSGAAG